MLLLDKVHPNPFSELFFKSYSDLKQSLFYNVVRISNNNKKNHHNIAREEKEIILNKKNSAMSVFLWGRPLALLW